MTHDDIEEARKFFVGSAEGYREALSELGPSSELSKDEAVEFEIRMCEVAVRALDALEREPELLTRLADYEAPRYYLQWSDRESKVRVDDPAAIADAVVSCALDHSYDRGNGVPYGLPDDMTARLRPIVARHLAAKRPDWLEHTVDMDGEERESLLRDVLAAVVEGKETP